MHQHRPNGNFTLRIKKPLNKRLFPYAGGGTRTHTSLRTQDFESSASASSATPASLKLYGKLSEKKVAFNLWGADWGALLSRCQSGLPMLTLKNFQIMSGVLIP